MGKRGQNEGTHYRPNDGRLERNEQSTMVLMMNTTQAWRVERSHEVKRLAAAVGIANTRIVQTEHSQHALPARETYMEERA